MEEKFSIDNGGNFYPKFTSNNPVVKLIMANFLKQFDQFVDQVAPTSIHEVGCGEGFIISRYASGKSTLRGTDMSSQVIEIARKNSMSEEPAIQFETRSIYDLDAEEDRAELVICSEVLEHVQDIEKALAKLQLITGSYLLISVPNEPLWRVLNIFRGKYIQDFGNTPGHINHWSKKGIATLVNKYFDVLETASPIPWTILLCKPKQV